MNLLIKKVSSYYQNNFISQILKNSNYFPGTILLNNEKLYLKIDPNFVGSAVISGEKILKQPRFSQK